MQFNPEVLAVVIGFMILSNRLVEALITPIFEKYKADKFWLMYIAWVVSGVLVYFANINLFENVIPSAIIGQILTAIVAGGGANLLHDIGDTDMPFVLIEEEEEAQNNVRLRLQ